MRTRTFAAITALTFFFFSVAAQAAENIREYAERLQETYGALQSFQADFTQTNTHRESGSTDTLTGKLYFKKPVFLRWEVQTPSPELLILTPDAAWQYIEEENTAYKYQAVAASDSSLFFRVLTGQSRFDEEFTISAFTRKEGLDHLCGFPKDPVPQMVEAEIWVDPASGYVQRVYSVDFYGNSMDVALSNFILNPTLPDSLFTFTPPPGVLVQDNAIPQQ